MELEEPGPSNAFDLEAYVSSYSSHTKIDRLLFIAEKAEGSSLELDALRIAADELKKADNVGKYLEVLQKINGRLGPAYAIDRNHVESLEKKLVLQQERLESQLQSHKVNLIKESIRTGHNELGDFYYHKGDLQNAFKCYVRTRDYCTSSRHILQMCLNVIKVSIEIGNFLHVQNYVAKADQTPEIQQDDVITSKLRAASGLAYIDNKKYKLAARKFVEVSPEIGTSYCDVITLQDIATYGALCSLATFDRQELKAKVITNINFREFLELVPEVRELVYDFYNSRYASCLTSLDSLMRTLCYDIHLHDHVETLYGLIRSKALVQYTTPFTSVNLDIMSEAFNSNISGLEKEVEKLIVDGMIQARIDSHNKVLYAWHDNIRNNTFHKVLGMGEEYIREAKALLLRANLMQHDLVQKPVRMRGGHLAPLQ